MLTSLRSTPRVIGTLMSLPLWLGMTSLSHAGTGTTTLNFTATFVQGTCDIYANSATSTNIPLGASSPAAIAAAGSVGVNAEDFAISFANCSNVVGGLPQLKISGTTITAGPAGNELFRDVAGTVSTGYGVRVVEKGQTVHLKNGDTVNIAGFLATNNLNTLNGTKKDFTASLSCGDCTTLPRTAGALKAAVVFDFVYN